MYWWAMLGMPFGLTETLNTAARYWFAVWYSVTYGKRKAEGSNEQS